MNCYEIKMGDQYVGNAYVETKGLFTAFRCQCNFVQAGVFRIYASYSEKQIDLGICVPDLDGFMICTKIPTKHLGEGEPVFYAVNSREENRNFYPVSCELPFEQMSKITDGKLHIENDRIGILFS